MSDQKIKLIPGVSVKNIDKVKKEYRTCENGVIFTLSAEDYKEFFDTAVSLLPEPIFFFIEAPKDADSDSEYGTYYLDNCTLPVAKMILKRYSGILYSDGVIRFGFGSHKTEEEIYLQEFQLVSIYSSKIKRLETVVKGLGYVKNDDAVTLWDVIDEDNPGMQESVEFEDESFYDIIENLKSEGLYEA